VDFYFLAEMYKKPHLLFADETPHIIAPSDELKKLLLAENEQKRLHLAPLFQQKVMDFLFQQKPATTQKNALRVSAPANIDAPAPEAKKPSKSRQTKKALAAAAKAAEELSRMVYAGPEAAAAATAAQAADSKPADAEALAEPSPPGEGASAE
jgi:hypothetical protein